MFELTTQNIGTLLVDGSAIFLLAGILSQTSIMRKRGMADDRMFFSIMLLDIFIAIADIVTYLADGKDFKGARYFNMGGVSVFYILLVLLTTMWLYYCMIRFKRVGAKEIFKNRTWLFVPGWIMEFLLLVNFFTGFIFSVDEFNVYHYGPLFIPMFAVMFFYIFAGFRYMSKYRVGDGSGSLIPVWIYMFPMLVGIIVPFGLGGISLTSIAVAVSIAFTHLGSASEIVIDNAKGGKA